MLLLAHMGIGSRLVKPWSKDLPLWGLLAGTVLPDVIDKPLYYAASLLAHEQAASAVSSTRTFGHTALFLIALTLVAVFRRSRWLAALALGVATHLLLDNLNDGLSEYWWPEISHPPQRSALVALLWPFLQTSFPTPPFNTLEGHFHRSLNPLSLGFEVIGAAILFWDAWQKRHESEILEYFVMRRQRRREQAHRRRKP
jgi:hypothetical protein